MSSHHPFGFSQIPGDPSFRASAVNAVAVVPLLSSQPNHKRSHNSNSNDSSNNSNNPPSEETHSLKSFRTLWQALGRHPTASTMSEITSCQEMEDELLLVVANSSLTRPGDWRYQDTPLKSFHWQHGCQRLHLFDGRPEHSRLAQDRLLNPKLTRDWIDLCPSRRTAAVIGVLNIHDCPTQQALERAQEELHQWATQRYATPPYQVTAHGSLGIARDQPVERLFVFDSFDEDCQHIDLSQTSASSSSILAFPPSDVAHSQMMDLHLNVVVNDLCVAIFQSLEARIRQSDELAQKEVVVASAGTGGSGHGTSSNNTTPNSTNTTRLAISRYISGGSTDSSSKELNEAEEPTGSTNLSLSSIAGLVSPENKLAQDSIRSNTSNSLADSLSHNTNKATPTIPETTSPAVPRPTTASNLRRMSSSQQTPPQLLTPLDEYYEWSNTTQLTAKDTDALRRRDMARREKLAADLSLLAGSPLDAYERYLKAAHLCKTTHPDPLWYAVSLLGCAATHIAMAEGGGYNVDEYLENNFGLPEEILALAVGGTLDMAVSSQKQTFPEVVFALCEEAMAILNRHTALAPFYAGLLLQMALYTAESAESHLRCRWGEGPGSFAGGEAPPFRWERATQVKVSLLKTKDGRDMIDINVMNRVKTICELLQQAVAVPDLDPATRLDIASQAARLCLEGIPGTQWKPTPHKRIPLPRKAAYFTVVAAEAMSTLNLQNNNNNNNTSNNTSNTTLENLWLIACQLYSQKPNDTFGSLTGPEEMGSYGWATLRASTLHGLSLQGTSPVCLEASEMLLALLEEIRPRRPKEAAKRKRASTTKSRPAPIEVGSSEELSVVSNAASGDDAYYTSSVTKMIRDSFTQVTATSSTLLATQAKWASDPPKRADLVPLAAQMPPKPTLLRLPAVWSSVSFDHCALAQRQCTERQKLIKKGLSTSSSMDEEQFVPILKLDASSTVPLSVSDTWSLEANGGYEIELAKRKVTTTTKEQQQDAKDGSTDVMATFYNPFEKKSSGNQQPTAAPVAAGEERVMTLYLQNFLSVPLQVKECQLNFAAGGVAQRINSAPVTFILPPQANDFPVQFPFTVLAQQPNTDASLESFEFEVEGIDFTCLHRRFSLSLGRTKDTADKSSNGATLASTRTFPKPAAYPYWSQDKNKSSQEDSPMRPKIEALPSQPRLDVCFSETGHSLNASSAVELGVTDGQLVSSQTFDLSNDLGPKRLGLLERLQIFVVGIPGGPSEKMLFDSVDASNDESKLSETEFLKDLASDNPPLVKVRILPGTNLDLDVINAPNAENTKARRLGFQLAMAEQFHEKLGAGSTEITMRVRYAGKFTETKEVWRRYDIRMKLVHFKGPRVVSMAFRPDLSDHPLIPELLQRFHIRRRANAKNTDSFESKESSLSCRVGIDHSVHVNSSHFVSIVTILNDSSSDIVLTRADGSPVSTFADASLSNVVVPRGVKVSIPMSIPRLSRDSQNTAVAANEIVKATKLAWKTAEDGDNSLRYARGNMSLEAEEISRLIESTPSTIPSVFEPPCTIRLHVQGKDPTQLSDADSVVSPGDPIGLDVEVSIAPWISADIVERCSFSVELFAVWLETPASLHKPRDHVWAGKVRRKFDLKEMQAKHAAKVILLQRGRYAVSACVRFSQDGSGDEVWWAEAAAEITVDPSKR